MQESEAIEYIGIIISNLMEKVVVQQNDNVLSYVSDYCKNAIIENLKCYECRDPGMVVDGALNRHSTFFAVAVHSIAYEFWNNTTIGFPSHSWQPQRIALALSNAARSLTGVDIHPGACIGRRFIIDHGYGTVIGESCIIGDDCYILNGVTLGARGIGNNQKGKRHPTIGHRVEIGAFARVYGNIFIGNDVKILPFSCVAKNIASNSIVREQAIENIATLRPSRPPYLNEKNQENYLDYVM